LAESERRRVTKVVFQADQVGRLVLGWEEWIALPSLGLPAIKAKIDTGAKTSALHAEAIEAFGPASAPRARFIIRPAPRRPDIAVTCIAPIIDRRSITSSNGIPEERFVIAADIAIGRRVWAIEISLSDRREMNYRMLIGRQALTTNGVLIDPAASFIQPKLGFAAYPGYKRKNSARQSN
jgi:ribosomal protein S6--L-glutamate ligase